MRRLAPQVRIGTVVAAFKALLQLRLPLSQDVDIDRTELKDMPAAWRTPEPKPPTADAAPNHTNARHLQNSSIAQPPPCFSGNLVIFLNTNHGSASAQSLIFIWPFSVTNVPLVS